MNRIKYFFVAVMAVSFGLDTTGAQSKIINVDTPDEFIDAIGSDRIIQLNGSTIYLNEITPGKEGPNFKLENMGEGFEVKIMAVNNMKIVGMGNKPVEIVTKPQYGNVIVFENCKNITIENVNAGHGPRKGVCSGGVFSLSNCDNFKIIKSIMYGSGTEGITANNCKNIQCKNSIIRGCTYSIMSLNNCSKVSFDSCDMNDNERFDLINIDKSIEVEFQNCVISNNQSESIFDGPNTNCLFNIAQSMIVKLYNCTIKSNHTGYFCNKANALDMKNTKLENNEFENGYSKE